MIGNKTVLEAIETVTQYFEDGNWVALTILSVFIAIPLFRAVRGAYVGYKERKTNDLKSALEIEGLSDDVRFVVQESLNRTYFYRATGLSGDHYLRTKVREFLESTRGDVSIFGVWRASEYIDVEDGKLVVRFSWYDKIHYYVLAVSSFLLFLISIFLWSALIYVWQGAVVEILPFAAQATLCFVMSIWFAWRASNHYIAEYKIKPAFKKYQNCDGAEVREAANEQCLER